MRTAKAKTRLIKIQAKQATKADDDIVIGILDPKAECEDEVA